MDKMWYIHTVAYYVALQTNDASYNMDGHWNYYAKWKKAVPKDKYFMILFMWNIKNSQTYTNGK